MSLNASKPMTKQEYLDYRGAYCPTCHSGNLTSEPAEEQVDFLTRTTTCEDCGESWVEIWKLLGAASAGFNLPDDTWAVSLPEHPEWATDWDWGYGDGWGHGYGVSHGYGGDGYGGDGDGDGYGYGWGEEGR